VSAISVAGEGLVPAGLAPGETHHTKAHQN
jgi:hypothetical protein